MNRESSPGHQDDRDKEEASHGRDIVYQSLQISHGCDDAECPPLKSLIGATVVKATSWMSSSSESNESYRKGQVNIIGDAQ